MRTFEDITQAKDGIMDFMIQNAGAILKHMVERFRKTMNSPSGVDEVVNLGKLIFANRDQLTAPAWELGAGLIAYATTNSWHGLSEDNLGNAIVANLRKDMGEITRAPDAPDLGSAYRIDPPSDESRAITPATGDNA